MVYLVVGIAGIVGALLRYYLGLIMGIWWHQEFPLATLITNLVGCFILGWITTYLSRLNILHPYLVTGLGTGLIGSFTTFSTFSVETVQLIYASHWGIAILYILMSLWGGILMSWIGFRLGLHYFERYDILEPSVERKGGDQS